MANTHRAFVMASGYWRSTGLAEDNGWLPDRQWVEFDEPKHKMIASGDYDFCLETLLAYALKHEYSGPAGVMACSVPGNPWSGEWVGVK